MKIMNKIKSNKGFTLIELIVVMAVIAILVLLAAPRFLGYTKDANVAAMRADAKMLSNIALVYHIENEATFPVLMTEGETPEMVAVTDTIPADLETLLDGATLYLIDGEAIRNEYKSLGNPIDSYGLVISGDLEGEVFHIAGVEDRNGDTFFGSGN